MRAVVQSGTALQKTMQKTLAIVCASAVLASTSLAQVMPANSLPNGPQTPTGPAQPFDVHLPTSHSPLSAYRQSTVPEPDLSNSFRLEQLIRDGKLYLSIRDAIQLAIENNLDLAIARYNLPIADTDILRTKAGGFFRGVNTGIVQTTQGGNSSGGGGAGAGGTSSGAGGAGAGAGGFVQNTLGLGSTVNTYDPLILANANIDHAVQPEYNLQTYGVPSLEVNTVSVTGSILEAFPTGTSVEFDFDNLRTTINSPYVALTPALNVYWQFTLKQQLLNGFGLGPNLRYLHIARNNKRTSDIAFKDQIITTVTQVEDIYWDLVNAYQDEAVRTRSRDFAQKTLDDTRKQFDLQAVAAIDVMRAESEVANREQDLTIARTNLQLEQSLIKNAITKNLDDPVLEQMPVVPTDTAEVLGQQTFPSVEDLISQALTNSTTLAQTDINQQNQQITRQSLRNNLLPTVTAVAYYGGSGLAGAANPNYHGNADLTVPPDFPGALGNAYNNSSPTYYVGLNLNIPLRNRIAKADQFRSELEYRQNQLFAEQTKKQIRLNVRNSEYTLEQSVARVGAATKARDLAQKTFEIDTQEQQLGAGSIYQTLTAQRDLSVAQSTLVTAQTTHEKAKIDLDRVVGTTLDRLGISIEEAKTGVVPQTTP